MNKQKERLICLKERLKERLSKELKLKPLIVNDLKSYAEFPKAPY